MFYTSRMKSVPAVIPMYLLHNTEDSENVCVIEPDGDGQRLFTIRRCICSDCASGWLINAARKQAFKVDAYGRMKGVIEFWDATTAYFDPSTILNEELAAQTAHRLQIGWRSSSIQYYREELVEFDKNREKNAVESKKYISGRIDRLQTKLGETIAKMQQEIEEVRTELQAVDSKLEARRQELLNSISENEAEFAKLTDGSSS